MTAYDILKACLGPLCLIAIGLFGVAIGSLTAEKIHAHARGDEPFADPKDPTEETK